jgi:hypothetical protein
MIQLQKTVTVQAPNEIDPESCDGIEGEFRLDKPIRTADCFSPMQRGAINNAEQKEQVCAQKRIVCDYLSPWISGNGLKRPVIRVYRRTALGRTQTTGQVKIPIESDLAA